MFSGIIIKLTSFCNLNCSYCYMFNLTDTRYKQVPKSLSIDLVEKLLDDVTNYCSYNNQKDFRIILHGGEPFLWGINNFKLFFKKINSINSVKFNISIQTNMYKLDIPLMKLLEENNVSIGISLDGPKIQHDKFRVTHNNKPSYEKIINNISKLFELGLDKNIGGFLTVADPFTDVYNYFDWIKSLPKCNISILWPIEYNYNKTPWESFGKTELEYAVRPFFGTWFAELYKLWWKENDSSIYVRLFNETLGMLLGSNKHGDSIVNDQMTMCVVNTDGAYEYHDYFRAFSEDKVKTIYNINNNSVFDVEKDIVFQKLFNLKDYLPRDCIDCSKKDICGGGFLAGRMKSEITDFAVNNSILCYDYYYYFETVQRLKRNYENHYTQQGIAKIGAEVLNFNIDNSNEQ